MAINAPTDITSLWGWWDASDASTFSYSSGVIVSQWNDKSGNAKHMTPPGSGPARDATQNSLSVLTFTSDWVMAGDSNTIAQPCTVYAVTKVASTTWGGVVAGGCQIRRSGADNTKIWFEAGGSTGEYTLDATDYHILGAVFNGASSSQRIDSAQVGTVNTGTNGFSPTASPRIGVDNDVNPHAGTIAEVIIWSKALNSTELGDVDSYLNAKWFGGAPAAVIRRDVLALSTMGVG